MRDFLETGSKCAETLRRMQCHVLCSIGTLNVGSDEDNEWESKVKYTQF